MLTHDQKAQCKREYWAKQRKRIANWDRKHQRGNAEIAKQIPLAQNVPLNNPLYDTPSEWREQVKR